MPNIRTAAAELPTVESDVHLTGGAAVRRARRVGGDGRTADAVSVLLQVGDRGTH